MICWNAVRPLLASSTSNGSNIGRGWLATKNQVNTCSCIVGGLNTQATMHVMVYPLARAKNTVTQGRGGLQYIFSMGRTAMDPTLTNIDLRSLK